MAESMKHAARVQDGLVVEVAELQKNRTVEESFHEDAGFVACPPNVTVGMSYDGKQFGPPPPPPPPSRDDLVRRANARQWGLANRGVSVDVGGQTRVFGSDEGSLAAMARKVARLRRDDAPTSVAWQFGDGSIATIDAAEFVRCHSAVEDFVQSTFDVLAGVLDGIAARKIKSYADIDKAAWPQGART